MSTEAPPPPPTEQELEAAAAQAPQPDADAMAELAAANENLTFAQKPMVQNVLPFVTSVAVHAGILIIAWILWDNRTIIARVIEEQIIVPDAAIVEGADVGGIPNPGLAAIRHVPQRRIFPPTRLPPTAGPIDPARRFRRT